MNRAQEHRPQPGRGGSGDDSDNDGVNRTDRSSLPLLPVAVVESHCHALEHVHAALRRRRLWSSAAATRRRGTKRRFRSRDDDEDLGVGAGGADDAATSGRRNNSGGSSWSMLHFDSHPDLACPSGSVPAIACFRPRDLYFCDCCRLRQGGGQKGDGNGNGDDGKKNLYELLDSTSTGMAEWILPLALAADLTRVEWIRPCLVPPPEEEEEEAGGDERRRARHHQDVATFPPGEHRYTVGAWVPPAPAPTQQPTIDSFLDLPETAVMKVDWDCPYYCDDDVGEEGNDDEVGASTASFAPREQLHLPRQLELCVSSLSSSRKQGRSLQSQQTKEDPWMLDVCLDYFACRNPFLVDLEAADDEAAQAFLDAVRGSEFYSDDDDDQDDDRRRSKRQERLRCFRKEMAQLLRAVLSHDADGNNRCEEVIRSLLRFYGRQQQKEPSPTGQGPKLLEDLVDSLRRFRRRSVEKEVGKFLDDAVQALPYLLLPHHRCHADGSHASDELREQLDRIRELLVSIRDDNSSSELGRPFMVTIARSSREGFTPPWLVEELQEKVLELLHQCYCNNCGYGGNACAGRDSGSCCLNVVFDYGEWEGSVI